MNYNFRQQMFQKDNHEPTVKSWLGSENSTQALVQKVEKGVVSGDAFAPDDIPRIM